MDKLADLPPKMGATAISALAFPQVERELEDWIHSFIDMAKDGVYHATGARREVGVLGDDVLSFLAAKSLSPQAVEISVSDRDIFHALRTTKVNPLPAEVWMKLPSLLANPEHIYWDLRKSGLVYVFPAPTGHGKIIVLVDYKLKNVPFPTNNVRIGQSIKDLAEFENTGNYERIR